MGTEDDGAQNGGCAPCDLAGIEDLACTAKKFQRQAEVMNEVATDLDAYRTQYGTARKDYAQAREGAAVEIDAINTQLEALKEQLRCRLTDEQRDCLEQARDTVFSDIDECTGPPGCCVGPCDFSDEIGEDDTLATLTARIDQYRRDTTASTACFTSLVAEPAELAKRVAALKAEVASLTSDVQGGGDAAKVARWYARWLIVETSLEPARIGNGYTSLSAFTDCLCRSLQCLISGWTVIAVLEGAKAELVCKEAGKQKACEKKKEDTLDAILEEYEKCCEPEDQESPAQTSQPTAQST